MKKINIENIERKLPFDVPEGYFDELPRQIQNRVQENEGRYFSINWSWKRTALAGIAASIIGVLLWVTYPQKQYTLEEESLSRVNNQEIVNYLKSNYLSQQEISDETQVSEFDTDSDDVILQELTIDDDDLKKAIQEQDIQQNI